MHVGLNLIYLVPGETGGMETYARELIPALVAEQPALRLTAFINREAAESSDGPWHDVPHVTVPVRARRRAEWVRGEQQLLPRLAAAQGIVALHSLASTAPAWGAFRRVVTIHDVIYRIYPEAHFGIRSWAMRLLVPLAARRSHRIIVPSRSTQDDLVRLLNVPPEKIDVVAEGIGSTGPAAALSESETRARYALDNRLVILATSAKRPHKNLPRLLAALALIPQARRPVLVLPGYSTPHETELRQRITAFGLENDVRLVGWVTPEELEGLYGTAACFVFPSLYEGFGLPVLEAMSRGVPVACSDRGSLEEIAGGAARLFDPEQPEAIAAAIESLLYDAGEAERYRSAGRARAATFSWRATARATLASYERALAPAERA
jgi:glycosyltransferase involved in cell wall biosynthesis